MPTENGSPSWREQHKTRGKAVHSPYRRLSQEAQRTPQPSANFLDTIRAERERERRRATTRQPKEGVATKKRTIEPQQKKHLEDEKRRRGRKRRRRVRLRALVLLILFLFICVFCARCTKNVLSTHETSTTSHHLGIKAPWQRLDVLSESAVLLDAKTGEVLEEKHANRAMAPASLTKMVAVYTALQMDKDIKATTTIDTRAFQQVGDNATAGLLIGATVTHEDLMYATILPSGADAVCALAVAESGDIKTFVAAMNQTATSLGMRHTHFTNPIGTDDEEHVSSAYDMAIFLREALKNETFLKILSTKSYTLNQHPSPLKVEHTVFAHAQDYSRSLHYGGAHLLGGKTGYTKNAGLCLATFAENDEGKELIAVTMGAAGSLDDYFPVFQDADTLYRLGFQGEENQ